MGDNHSLSEKVFHKLQEDILSGKYAVDEELKEKTIGDELGVSRTPVREALRQLELQGLVTITPNKGAHVTGFSKEDLNDIYEIIDRMEEKEEVRQLARKMFRIVAEAEAKGILEYLGIPWTDDGEETDYEKEVRAAVAWLTENGIMRGNSQGDLMLDQPLTRRQFAVMEYRIAKLEGFV